MTRRSRMAAYGLLFLFLFVFVSTEPAAAEVVRWEIDGETREAIIHAPADQEGDRVPLILSFHGYGDTMHNFQHTNLHEVWPDAVVVYFQGLPTLRGIPGWQLRPGDHDDRDLKLVDAALTSLRATYPIDDDRIYATGFSMGGMFTYLLWTERGDIFAAYAPVAGRLLPAVRPTQPGAVLHVAGETDRVVSFADQEDAIEVAVSVNNVGETSTASCGDGCTIYGPDTPSPVMTWIHPAGHIYPRGTAARIVSFFRHHRRSH